MKTIKKLVLVLAFCWPVGLFAQTNIYVSPKGNDANKGSQTNPFASISKAVAEARKKSGAVVIYLTEGAYYLKGPEVFTSDDSRNEYESLTITNFENKKVTVTGSIALNLKWKQYKNGIWQAKVKQDLIFDELFINGQLQRMARYPNYDSKAQYYGGTAADAVSKERAARWKSPGGGYVHALHCSMWGDFHYRITGKNEKDEPILEGGWQNNRRMPMHDKYRFVENVFEEKLRHLKLLVYLNLRVRKQSRLKISALRGLPLRKPCVRLWKIKNRCCVATGLFTVGVPCFTMER